MLKRNNKAISLAIIFFFCMSFMVPGLMAPQVAEAAAGAEYTVLTAMNTGSGDGKQLGKVKVEVKDVRAIAYGKTETLTVTLPSGIEFPKDEDGIKVEPASELNIKVTKTDSKNSRTLEVTRKNEKPTDKDDSFVINFNKINVKRGSGDIEVKFSAPSGSVFPEGKATIGRVGGGDTKARVESVKTIGDGGGKIDDIVIEEGRNGVIKTGNKIEIKLPSGFTWDNAGTVETGWGFENADIESSIKSDNNRILVIDFSKLKESDTYAGKVTLKDAKIGVSNTSKTGEIEVNIKGVKGKADNNNISDEDIIVAKYGEYDAGLKDGTVKELISGDYDQKIGEFFIEEEIPGSLVPGRAIYLELPSGVKWYKAPEAKVEEGADNILKSKTADIVSNSSFRKAKFVVNEDYSPKSDDDAAVLKIKDGKVYVEPGFEGDIEITISGSAGIEGTVKVAEVVKGVTITAGDKVPDIVVGKQAQKVADIVIKENKKEAIKEKTHENGDQAAIVIELDEGYTFYKKPKVTVDEGDLEIDDVKLSEKDSRLEITIDSESTKPSTIVVSDVYVNALRYATEGKVVASLRAADGKDGDNGSTALDRKFDKKISGSELVDDNDAKFSGTSVGQVVVANCITPADLGGTTATFKINSNVYVINGVSKVMDVAPYIKGDRTFMPIRYVAYAMGLTDDDVIWDEAAQKVTMTKGDTVVEMTIGSDTIYINGEAQAMDVAPEITNSRTMLPIRFIAEAFGAKVGWDPSTYTVVIN